MSGAAPRTYSGRSTSVSNSLPSGHEPPLEAREIVHDRRIQPPAAECVNLGRHRAGIRDNKVRCTPFLVVFGSRTR